MTKINYFGALATILVAALAAGLLMALVIAGTKPAGAQAAPSNGKIAFKSDRAGNQEIYVMNAALEDNTNQPQRLTTDPALDFSPDISPDGNRIVFMSDREDDNEDIYIMDTQDIDNDGNGDNLVRLTNHPATDLRPTFSPDRTRIVFESYRDGNYEIYTMLVAAPEDNITNPPQRLTSNPATDYAPDFSPDGTRIAFSSNRNRDGDYEIYTMNSDGTGRPTRLTNNSTSDRVPDYAPDGRIAFSNNGGGKYKIFVMNADGSRKTRLPGTSGSDYGPDFSPDGTQIAFYSYPTSTATGDIYTMNANGKATTRLTTARGEDTLPSWGPVPVAPTTP